MIKINKEELPQTIKVIGKNYKITYNKHSMKYKENGENRLAIGFHYANEGKMKVKIGNMCKDEIANTLLHESFHGISCRLKLELTEKQVDNLTIGAQALLKDNPKLYNLLKP